jgi:hypothetical protein
MKRLIPVLVVLCLGAAALALFSSPSSAAGINLAWDDCGSAGVANKAFLCDTNTGGFNLIGSFVPPAGVTKLSGNEIVIDFTSGAAAIPEWWKFKTASTCRQTALSVSFGSYPSTACYDYGLDVGAPSGSIASYTTPFTHDPQGVPAANWARIKLIWAVGASVAGPVNPPTEYYSFKLTMSAAKTVGSPICAGCETPVCVVLNMIRLTQPPGLGNFDLSDVIGSKFATWQGGAGADCQAVPAKSTTWGQIKSLYR